MSKEKKTNLLIWKGGDPFPGWPASDHEEPDPVLYQEKLASKLYRTPDAKEDNALYEQQQAAKALADANAAKAAQESADRAQVMADAAAAEAERKRANAEAARVAARRRLEEAEHGAN